MVGFDRDRECQKYSPTSIYRRIPTKPRAGGRLTKCTGVSILDIFAHQSNDFISTPFLRFTDVFSPRPTAGGGLLPRGRTLHYYSCVMMSTQKLFDSPWRQFTDVYPPKRTHSSGRKRGLPLSGLTLGDETVIGISWRPFLQAYNYKIPTYVYPPNSTVGGARLLNGRDILRRPLHHLPAVHASQCPREVGGEGVPSASGETAA